MLIVLVVNEWIIILALYMRGFLFIADYQYLIDTFYRPQLIESATHLSHFYNIIDMSVSSILETVTSKICLFF